MEEAARPAQRALRERIVEAGGEVVQQTGDGFAAFDNPKAAIEAAIAIQRALDAEIVAPDVRIGAHTGGAFESDGESNQYGGEAVHLAARIGAAAGAAEILVSRDTLDGVGGGSGCRSLARSSSRASTSRSRSSRSTGASAQSFDGACKSTSASPRRRPRLRSASALISAPNRSASRSATTR